MRLRYKILCVVIILCWMHGFAFAQQALTIKGVVFIKSPSSNGRISQALITNLNSKVLMVSDELGGFKINAAVGDTLLITKSDYTPEKRVVVNSDDLAIYMQPIIKLNEVTIKEMSKKQELNDVMRQYRSDGIFNDGKSLPAWTFINSPLTGLYNLFGKEPAEARRFAAFSKDELETDEVSRRYTKELVKSVTKLPDDEVVKFMQTFTPSYEDVKSWNDYQLIMYIKKSFAYYEKNKDRPQPKLQKLY